MHVCQKIGVEGLLVVKKKYPYPRVNFVRPGGARVITEKEEKLTRGIRG